jgi:hypothetical protein
VSLHVWGTSNVPKSLLRMGIDRRTARALPGCTFAKLLGTGSGRTFSLRDPDLHHWALLACWSEASGPERSARSAPFAEWASIASEQARFLLRPLSSRGSWSARAPFGDPSPTRWDGPIASLTRARIKPQRWAGFWRSVPAVAYDANHGPGMLFGLGIGEAPVGLQGTFSVWRDKQVLDDFAYQRSPHARVIEQTAALQWYAEELFARFALLDVSGRYDGADLAGLVSGGAPDPAGPPAAV